jgi:hypothetical protein
MSSAAADGNDAHDGDASLVGGSASSGEAAFKCGAEPSSRSCSTARGSAGSAKLCTCAYTRTPHPRRDGTVAE